MPLTQLQKRVLDVLAACRSAESHFAGGIVLHAAIDSSRYSRDFDICHATVDELVRIADEQPDLPTGVAFIDREGRPGWIGDDPNLRIHFPSLGGCWPTVRSVPG